MNDWLIAHATGFRFGLWLGVFVSLALPEQLWPRRHDDLRHRARWRSNFGLMIVSSVLAALMPVTALSAAVWAQAQGWGLLNTLTLPTGVAVFLAWLLLDAAMYGQHRAMHRVPVLWRLHRVHHTDVRFDTSTAVRFHPAEIVLSVLYKCAVIIALGAPPLAVLIFEVLLSGVALFNHANWHVKGDRWLRKLLVTPDLHRIHHSVHRAETDSNYGNVLSLWDHLFRSHTAQPRDGQTQMRIGLSDWRDETQQGLGALLVQPLQRPPSTP